MLTSGITGAQLPGLGLKAWAYFTGAGILLKSFNISSFSRSNQGTFTLNFSNAMQGVNYFATGQFTDTTGAFFYSDSQTTAAVAFRTINNVGSATDFTRNYVAIYE